MIKYFLAGTALVLLSSAITTQAATCNGKKVTTEITEPGTYNGVGDQANVVLIKSAQVEYYGGSKADTICIDYDTNPWIYRDGNFFFWGVVVYGGDGNDYIRGSDQDDMLLGGDGDDTIGGRDGYDYIWGDGGKDKLYGDDGNDLVQGGGGTDRIFGGDGEDIILAGWYFSCRCLGGLKYDIMDELFDGAFSDPLIREAMANAHPSTGDDIIQGDNGDEHQGNDDVIFGSNGDNKIYGNGGNDSIWDFGGNDLLHGDDGDDRIFGGDGGDTLRGLGGDDTLLGGGNDDVLRGGDGFDECYEDDESSWDDCDD